MSKTRMKASESSCEKGRTEKKDQTGSKIDPAEGVMFRKQNEMIAQRRNENENRNESESENENVDAGSVNECVPGCLCVKYALPSLV